MPPESDPRLLAEICHAISYLAGLVSIDFEINNKSKEIVDSVRELATKFQNYAIERGCYDKPTETTPSSNS